MSEENWLIFKDVKMYRDDSTDPAESNMESLFYLPELGVDPPSSSLFNLDTIKQLISLGQSTANVISSKDQVYGSTF